ncbi:MAG: pyridoxal phosphate-dependent aminotransferase [Peptococcaceae bacterium]
MAKEPLDLKKEADANAMREIFELAGQIKDAVKLEIGEPLFTTPEHIIEAAFKAAKDGHTKYTPNAGHRSLREKIAARLNREYNLDLNHANVVVTTGGLGALATSIKALIADGEEILIPDPSWPVYETIITAVGGTSRYYQLKPEDNYLPSAAEIAQRITPRTKVLLFNSPSNPLGVVFPAEKVKELISFAKERNLFIIADEVYEKLVYEGVHTPALSYDTDSRVIGIYSFSKTYAMTGWRIGYAVAPQAIAQKITKLQEPFTWCASDISQMAAEAALDGPQDCVTVMKNAYQENVKVAENILNACNIKYQPPQGSMFMWINIGPHDSGEFCKDFLRKYKVATAPGISFGPTAKNFLRISLVAKREDIETGLTRLAAYLQSMS